MPEFNLPRSFDKCASLGRWFMRTRLVARHPGRIPSSAGAALGLPHIRETTAQAQIGAFQAGSLLRALPRHHPSRRSLRPVDADIRPLFEPARMIIKATSLATCETIVVQ